MKPKLFVLFLIAVILCKGLSAQNVGIGTTTPQTKLDVNGDFKISKGVAVNNISADSNFVFVDDSTLITQNATKRYMRSGKWLPSAAPTSLSLLSDVTTPASSGTKSLIAINGSNLYTTTNTPSSIIRHDITNPALPAFVNSVTVMGSTTISSIVSQGSYVYTTTPDNDRLYIYNADLTVRSFTNAMLDEPQAVFVQGNYAYVASLLNNRLCVFDISNPDNIAFVSYITTESPFSVTIDGNYAYVLSNSSRISKYDISDPANMVYKCSFVDAAMGLNASFVEKHSIAIRNNFAYVPANPIYNRLYIFDVSATDTISETGFISVGKVRSAAAQGNLLYVTTGAGFMEVDDIRDPAHPVRIASSNKQGTDIVVKNDYVYTVITNDIYTHSFNPATVISFDGSGNLAVTNRLNLGASAGIGSNATGGIDFTTSNTTQMVITSTGRIGIGTTTPSVPLEVNNSVNYNVGSYQYFNQTGSGFFSSTNSPVSIRAASKIVASEFNANSDVRIKRNISSSTPSNDLATLLRLRVTDYQLKDSVYYGNGKIKGFIAQELEKIMPQAVHTSADYVPDIYCLSTLTEYNEKDQTLKISLCKPHQLKVGDKVKTFAGDGMQEQYVVAINDASTFTLGNWQIKQAGMNPVQKVFVWGKWTDDFHTVDYNQVFALGISAIQQLAKENEEQKKINQSLQQQIDELKKLLQPATK
ncbi:tail fiber domain-containing protein [Ferruginibacter sp.]